MERLALTFHAFCILLALLYHVMPCVRLYIHWIVCRHACDVSKFAFSFFIVFETNCPGIYQWILFAVLIFYDGFLEIVMSKHIARNFERKNGISVCHPNSVQIFGYCISHGHHTLLQWVILTFIHIDFIIRIIPIIPAILLW